MLRKKLWMWVSMMAVLAGCGGAAKAPEARSAGTFADSSAPAGAPATARVYSR